MKKKSPAKRLVYIRDKKLGDCTRCKLSGDRDSIVFGEGGAEADIIIVAEAPDDHIPEGELLAKWLEVMKIDPESVYATNTVKCKPKTRKPSPTEIETCLPFFHLQVMAIQPKVIIALGRVAAGMLIGNYYASFATIRKQPDLMYECKETGMKVPLIASYHPSHVMRKEGGYKENGKLNKLVMADLTKALSIIDDD